MLTRYQRERFLNTDVLEQQVASEEAIRFLHERLHLTEDQLPPPAPPEIMRVDVYFFWWVIVALIIWLAAVLLWRVLT
jgi:hypothetical protein